MAIIQFFSQDYQVQNLNGSGLGFYGSSFGSSVSVGSYQDSTWITSSTGTTQGPQCNNVKWTHPNSGSINSLASKNLLDIPNYLAPLAIRFSHTSAVKTQNAKLYIYDRTSISNNASGVITKAAEIIHPSITQTGSLGSGDSSWRTPNGISLMYLVNNPGTSGLSPGGENSFYDHQWHLAISASPDSIGSKTLYGLYFTVEYL